jgi:hypothetical protein
MKNTVMIFCCLMSFLLLREANAAPCSLGLAKKFADGVIAVEVSENNYPPGKLVFSRTNSREYTKAYLQEQIDLLGKSEAAKYIKLKSELEANSALRIYRLQYSWQTSNNQDLGFYYVTRLKNYDGDCTLESLISD